MCCDAHFSLCVRPRVCMFVCVYVHIRLWLHSLLASLYTSHHQISRLSVYLCVVNVAWICSSPPLLCLYVMSVYVTVFNMFYILYYS